MNNFFGAIGYVANKAAKAISRLSCILNSMPGGKNNPIKFSKMYRRK